MVEDDRNSRLMLLEAGNYPASRIFGATAIVGGVGALGNEVAKCLALLGWGTIILVDLDTIELSNLSRSVLFRESDVGRPKVDGGAGTLRSMNPRCNVIGLRANIGDIGLGLYRRADVVFSCFDQRYPRFVVNDACVKVARPWIDAGLGAENHRSARVNVYDGGTRRAWCYACPFPPERYSELMFEYGGGVGCHVKMETLFAEGLIASIPTIASIAAGVQVQFALEVLGDDLKSRADVAGRGFSFDMHTSQAVFRSGRAFSHCPVHERWDSRAAYGLRVIEQKDWRTDRMTVSEFFEALEREVGTEHVSVALPEGSVGVLVCEKCSKRAPLFTSNASYKWLERKGSLRCRECGESGHFRRDPELPDLPTLHRGLPGFDGWLGIRTLREIGVRPFDIVRAVRGIGESAEDDFYFEFSGDADWLLTPNSSHDLCPKLSSDPK